MFVACFFPLLYEFIDIGRSFKQKLSIIFTVCVWRRERKKSLRVTKTKFSLVSVITDKRWCKKKRGVNYPSRLAERTLKIIIRFFLIWYERRPTWSMRNNNCLILGGSIDWLCCFFFNRLTICMLFKVEIFGIFRIILLLRMTNNFFWLMIFLDTSDVI